MQQLVSGVTKVEIHCVSGNLCMEGNKQVYRRSKDAVLKSDIRRRAERFTLLVHVNQTINGRKWKDVKH